MVREELERSFQMGLCNCFTQRLLCRVSIRVGIPILGSHSGFSGFSTRLAALETEICVCSQAEWANSPLGHPCASAPLSFSPLAQLTLLLQCSLSFCGSQGGITRQGQVNAVLEYFSPSLGLALGCDEQKEHQASCACRDGSHLAPTTVWDLGSSCV